MERFHSLMDDERWLPAIVARLVSPGWLVVGVLGAAAWVGFLTLWPWTWDLATLVGMAGAGGAMGVGASQAARDRRKALAALARGDFDVGELSQVADGEVVRVHGKVVARETLAGFLDGTRGVYRRLVFEVASGTYVHEAAFDFELVDEAGRVVVTVADAHLLVAEESLAEQPAEPFLASGIPRIVELIRYARGPYLARETMLVDGAVVTVVGVKTAVGDVRGTSTGYRELPVRVTLGSSPTLPLMIIR